MKYGKYLAKRQLDIPEYANYFMNYKALKKVYSSALLVCCSILTTLGHQIAVCTISTTTALHTPS